MRNKPDSTFLHLGNYVFDNITDVCVCVCVRACVCGDHLLCDVGECQYYGENLLE